MADVIQFNGTKHEAAPTADQAKTRLAQCAQAAEDIAKGLHNVGMKPNDVAMVGLIMVGTIAGFIPDDEQRAAFLTAADNTIRSFADESYRLVQAGKREVAERMSKLKEEASNNA